MLQIKINPDCYVHNNRPYFSTVPPQCICGVYGMPDDSTCRDSGIKLPEKHDCQCIYDDECPNSESTLELKRQISDLYNEMGNFSMRINENYSKMREFEKQRVNPKFEEVYEEIKTLWRRVHDLSELRYETHQNEGCTRAKVENDLMPMVNNMRDQIHVLEKRLEAVEYSVVNCHCNDGHAERIEKLEKEINNLSDNSIEVCNNHLERIEKLEAITSESYLNPNMLSRIDQLEKDSYAVHEVIDAENMIAWKGALQETNQIQKNILQREIERDKRIEKLEKANEWQTERNGRDHERMKALEQIFKVQHYPNGTYTYEIPNKVEEIADNTIKKWNSYYAKTIGANCDRVMSQVIGGDFVWAMMQLVSGKKVRQKSWVPGCYWDIEDDFMVDRENIEATDWEVME